MPDILLFHKIYSKAPLWKDGEVVVFDITDKEGINRDDAKQMIASLEKEQLINKVYDTDELIIVSVTERGNFLGHDLIAMLR
jgi:DNA-binding MarR family transcriptional regulator